MVVLDEMTYPLSFGWLDAHKPGMLHFIITVRDALPELVAYADLVTEMRAGKHSYEQQGIKAQPGIEY